VNPAPVFAPTEVHVVVAGSIGPREGPLSEAVTDATRSVRTTSDLLDALADVGARFDLAVSVTAEEQDGSIVISATYAATEAELVEHHEAQLRGELD
jgi:hypothetical protein